MIKMLWDLCYPVVLYGLSVDLFSLLFKQRGPLACTLAGAAVSAPFLLAEYMRRRRGKEDSRWDRKKACVWALAGIAGCLVVNTLIKAGSISRLFPGFSQTVSSLYGPPVWFQAATMGLVIPAAEELAFRGLVFTRLREDVDFLKAACLSSALFALWHGNVLQGVYGFVMGLMFAGAMEREKTIAAPLVMHMAANLTSIAVTAAGGAI